METENKTAISDWLEKHGKQETAEFVKTSLQFADLIREGLEKTKITEEELANKMDEPLEVIKKMQGGFYNFTMRQIVRLGIIFKDQNQEV